MTSFPRSKTPARDQASTPARNNFSGQSICLVAGLTCLAGFAFDLLVLGTPPEPFALEWRVNFLQQAGDRSIILFFGMALLLYSIFDNRQIKRSLSLISLAIGVAFLLSSLLVIRDSLTLKNQAFNNISTQEEQIQTRIDQTKASGELPAEISLEQIQQASQEISVQAEAAKKNTSQGITKAGMASLGNLVVIGLGLVGLGRVGLRRRA